MTRPSIVWSAALAATVFGISATGWTSVGPGEVVVVRRLGRVLLEPWGPGFHWGFPPGIDQRSSLRLDEIRRVSFGRVAAAGPADEPGEGEYLSGDRNLVRVQGVVQYRVADPIAYLLRSEDLDRWLAEATEASVARALSSVEVDAPLGPGRLEVARSIRKDLADEGDRLGLGIAVLGVNLTEARPPTEVEPAFLEAQAARSDRDRRIVEARAILGMIRPAALASAEATTQQAHAQATRSLELARGQSQRFLALLTEAEPARGLTVRRIYRDALRDLLPRVRRKVLMTPDEPVDLGLFGPGSR